MPLLHLNTPQLAQGWCEQQRQLGNNIGFVPTMGALHEGHLSLIRAAQQQTDDVVVSIFVNPLQFNNPEDLAKYPRDLEADLSLLRAEGVAMVFTGEVSDFYTDVTSIHDIEPTDPGPYAQGMEGAHRPGHFEGVREIVSRLFFFSGPCTAFFGEKDFQQVQIIKQLAVEMGDIEVVTCPTSRETSGLAHSSRNARLSDEGKHLAAVIHQALTATQDVWNKHERLAPALRQEMLTVLNKANVNWEYAEVVDPNNWTATTPAIALEHARGLIALEIDGVRLIDNMLIGKESDQITLS
ncbi:MAG: pantoate--beta-alanine ligase [Parvicella sp.]|jgi:pantoate--beta-alanine ligase